MASSGGVGSRAMPIFVDVPIDSTLSSVPMPGRSPSGHHRARIGMPSRMLIVPISWPVCRAMPWFSASHGPRPSPASTINAIPKPNRTSPTMSAGMRGAAARRSSRPDLVTALGGGMLATIPRWTCGLSP